MSFNARADLPDDLRNNLAGSSSLKDGAGVSVGLDLTWRLV